MTFALPPVHPSVVHMLESAVRDHPDGAAVVCGQVRLTYRDYAASIAAFATELRQHGAAGERVAVIMRNSADAAVAMFAAQAAGAQLVPLNPAYTAFELSAILEDADPRVIIFDDDIKPVVQEAVSDTLKSHLINVAAGRLLLTSGGAARFDVLPDSDTPAMLQYTGGTTGRAKGVNLTHSAISSNVSQREALLPTDRGRDRILVMTPLFHSYASAMGLYLAAYAASCLVIVPRYTPQEVLRLAAAERITRLAGSPTVLSGLLACESLPHTDLSTLKVTYSGSAALPEETLRRWEEISGAPVCEGYGQTEAGPVVAFNPEQGTRKRGSVGVPVPLTDVQIVDIANGRRVLPVGTEGEIRVRGPQVMSGYRNRPQETAEALRDGWLYTGDIGVFDADGYLTIRDRKKEMAIISGYNVYPREVEEVLHASGDVEQAAVVAAPHAHKGEILVAFVVLARPREDAEQALTEFCSQRLVRYKLPSTFIVLDRLPQTAVGKPDKTVLKRMAGELK